jgi:signal transduction histidine kinase
MRRLADLALGVCVGSLVAALAWLAFRPRGRLSGTDAIFDVVVLGASITLAIFGRLIVRRADNRIGIVLGSMAVGGALITAIDILVKSSPVFAPGWLPWVGLLGNAGELIAVGAITILLPVFPSGGLASPRWRWVGWLWAAGIASATCASIFRAGPFGYDVDVQNPIGIPAADEALNVLSTAGGLALIIVVGAGIASLVALRRHGDAEVRAQVRWLALDGSLALTGFLLAGIGQTLQGDNSWIGNLGWLMFLTGVVIGIPAAVSIAVFRYRLYDIDVVIRKTVVFGLLAAFITVVYAAIVGLVSARFERAGSFVAAATLAVLFAPARDRARKIADRLVYGRRATPYEVLAEFSDQVGGAYATDDVLVRMAQVLMEGTGASGARVLLQVGTEQREAAFVGDRGDETVVKVTHQGEDLGALAVSMPVADPMNPAKQQLIEDLAAQAGLVLRNVKLIEELKASRQRLVAAQDEERRKIERNIHDGAQQQLVAMAVQLKLATQLVGKDPDKERELIAKLGVQANEALEDLRDLARGIYPPLLADKGIPAALEAQARRAAVPTSVAADGIGRFSQDVESAVYFSCLEALQNIAKYAEASEATIAVSNGSGELRFSVTDDGRGFDPAATGYGTGLQGIADRLAATGGELAVTSRPGAGTTIRGNIPTSGSAR